MSDIILYSPEDGKSQIQLRADLGTVWLTQLEMAELFQITKENFSKHLKAIFSGQRLSRDSVVNHRVPTAADGKNRRVAHHSLRTIWLFPILYPLCRELPSPIGRGNCQGVLASSGTKTLTEKWSASARSATRCAAISSPRARQ